MLIMGGHFQSQFLHAVPTYNEMLELVKYDSGAELKLFSDQPMLKIVWSADSRNRMIAEVNRLTNVNLGEKEHRRWNVTMRMVSETSVPFMSRGPKGKRRDSGEDRLN